MFEHISILGTLKSPSEVYQAYEDIKTTPAVKFLKPDKQVLFLTKKKKAITPAPARVASPDFINTARSGISSMYKEKHQDQRATSIYMDTASSNSPECNIKILPKTSLHSPVPSPGPEIEFLNGKELNSLFTHFKNIVKI